MSVSQADKAKKLRALHEAPGSFVIPNPWDAGSARMLEGLGFQALATSSGAKADLDDVIMRLKAFEEAGADVLMAPGLPDLAAVKKVTGALKKPFNFMVGIPKKSFSQAELEAAGVKRISLATSLYKAAMTG